jgi:hypothetical protein
LIYLVVDVANGKLLGVFETREEADLVAGNSPAHCKAYAVVADGD